MIGARKPLCYSEHLHYPRVENTESHFTKTHHLETAIDNDGIELHDKWSSMLNIRSTSMLIVAPINSPVERLNRLTSSQQTESF